MFNFTDYKSPIQEGIRLPSFKPSFADLDCVGLKEGADNYDLLRKLCFAGIKKLGIDNLPNYDKYIERAKHELKTLKDLCLVDYMLIVWDILNFCRNNKIPRGPARGSSAGSLVAYLTGITEKVDPIKYNLYFERFLSVDRVQPYQKDGQTYLKDCADIDVDISYFRRHEVLEYINTKYSGQTAQITTLATLSGKMCIKECAKIVAAHKEEDAQLISNMVERTFGVVNPLKECYDEVPSFKEWSDKNKKAYKIARRIENLVKNFGVHASGLIISPDKREYLFPCQKSKDGLITSGWEMNSIGDIAVKIDCLGLRTLDLLAVAEKESGVSMDNIDPEDSTIYKQFEELDHKYGLFQIETDSGFRITKQIKPHKFSHLSDIVAINRPGAIIFLKDYLDYKNGEREIPKVHPVVDEILKETGGVLLMQEQTMRILNEVYKFTLVEANVVRKIIGKKLKKEMPEWEGKIRKRGEELGINSSITDWFWSSVKASAEYQFNACLDPKKTSVNEQQKGNILLKNVCVGDKIKAFNTKRQQDHFVTVSKIYKQKAIVVRAKSPVYPLTINCSLDHKFLATYGGELEMVPLWKVLINKLEVKTNWVGSPWGETLLVLDGLVGEIDTIDLEVDHEDHNFYANGIVVSNSHSRAYSLVTAYCAWYKANKPKEFFLGALKLSLSESKPQDIISEISQELPRFGIKLLPPDLAISGMDFNITSDGNIRYGLSAIKGIGEKKLEALSKFRDAKKPTTLDIYLSSKQAGLNIGSLSSLIQAGTLDSFGMRRTDLVLDAQVFNQLTPKEQREFITLAPKYDWSVVKIIRACMSEKIVGENAKPIMSDKRIVTLRKKCAKYFEIQKLNSAHEKFANWYFEKKLLGYSYSQKLKDCFEIPMLGSEDIPKLRDWQRGTFIGVVTDVKKSTSAAGNLYMKLSLSDEENEFQAMLLDNKKAKNFSNYFNNGGVTPLENDILIVSGAKKDDVVFIDSIKVVSEKIYTKLSELPDKD